MKLVSMACPNCGARLEVNDSLKKAACNFCGYTFLIDDEVQRVSLEIQNGQQLGRDLEIGRRSVRGANVELAREVYDLIEPISTLDENRKKIERFEKSIKDDNTRAFWAKIATAVVPAVLIVMFIIAHLDGERHFGATDLAVILFYTAIPAIIWLCSALNAQSREKSLEKVKDAYNSAMESLEGLNLDIIPPAYRNREALTFFYDALYNQRAMTIQEAVLQYDSWKRRT